MPAAGRGPGTAESARLLGLPALPTEFPASLAHSRNVDSEGVHCAFVISTCAMWWHCERRGCNYFLLSRFPPAQFTGTIG